MGKSGGIRSVIIHKNVPMYMIMNDHISLL